MNLIEAIQKANRPGLPEDSIRLRVACAVTVLVSIAAAVAEFEMARTTGVVSAALIVSGMIFSYRTRVSPPGWTKVAVAVAAVLALIWFIDRMSKGPITDIATVENSLTVLFAAILVVHSFHVPARRDLLFALVASAALMAIGAAQAITLGFAAYAILWVGCGLWCLMEMWHSASFGGRSSPAGATAAVSTVVVVAAIVFLLLPAPVVAIRVDFAESAGSGGPVPIPGAHAGDAGSPAQLSRPGAPSGPTRVGGYLGFAGSLDTAVRGKLSNNLVMRVRANRPSYWVGETFDTWDGESWSSTVKGTQQVGPGSPFSLPISGSDSTGGQTDLQTFYIQNATANLIFHADTARQVWYPATTLFWSNDDSIVSPVGMGRGAIYTVDSTVATPTPSQLRQDQIPPPSQLKQVYTNLPHPYPQVSALAHSVTAGATNAYDQVQDLISWMGANTRYSTDIPPLPPGADTVNEFLFGDRVGFCEQISTSLAVMLRSLGVPVREVVGYVPGAYNPVTDLYDVRADDAHAWVQVWFPGYGWQSFDPTADVPLANPSPGSTAVKDVTRALSKVPPVPVAVAAGVIAAAVISRRISRTRPRTWAEKMARRIERSGRRAGRRRQPGETLAEYAAALDGLAGDRFVPLAEAAEASAYGGRDIPPDEQRRLLSSAGRR